MSSNREEEPVKWFGEGQVKGGKRAKTEREGGQAHLTTIALVTPTLPLSPTLIRC